MTNNKSPPQTQEKKINDDNILLPNCNKANITTSNRNYQRVKLIFNTVLDVIIFLIVSLGFILKAIYQQIVGYPETNLAGELALITGGGGGLGRLIALKLATLGVNIVIWDINQEGIDETIQSVRKTGISCVGYVVDISDKEEVYRMAEIVKSEIGDVTMLINNAGVASGRALLDTPDDLIVRSFNVNVLAHFWTVKAFLPSMLERNHGHIVTIASLAGHVGIAKLVDYCSSKFAAVGFDEALRMELEILGSHVQTTCICPFFIQSTGMFETVNSRWVPTLSSEDVAKRVVTAIRKKEKVSIIPSYLLFMLTIKWVFPWGCNSGFLRRIVPDAAPQHGLQNGIPHIARLKRLALPKIKEDDFVNNNKGTPLLIHRTPAMEERVL